MSDISQSNKLNIREQLITLAKQLPSNDVAICLSSGVDSQSILFALLEAKKRVVAYSFTLEDRKSRDFIMASKVCSLFNVEFVPILLPISVEQLKLDILRLRSEYKCTRKTEYECTWPFLYVYGAIKEPIIAHGIGSDGHFCLSKKGMMHFKNNIDEYRRNYWKRVNGGQKFQHNLLASKYNKIIFEPYKDRSIIDYFSGTSWEDVNRPKQKQPILNSFSEYFEQFEVYPHTNFQLGDSGIAKHFDALLDTDWNIHNYKSVVGIFNAVNRGELSGRRKLI